MLPRVDGDGIEQACREGLGEDPPRVDADENGARALLGWLVARVARKRFEPEAFREAYCSRTPRSVLAQKCVPFTAPCADLSGIAALLLARSGITSTLVLGGISRALRPVKFQCGLELELPRKGTRGDDSTSSWVVGFGVSRTFFYEGRFEPVPRRPWVFRRRPEALDLDTPFLASFCEGGRDGLARLVPGYDLERDLRDHVRRSGRIAFFLARRRARAEEGASEPRPVVAAPQSWEAA